MSETMKRKRRTWRRKTKVSVIIALITASALIYWEQTAVLYVVSTLAVCIQLLLVAFSDLENKDKQLSQSVFADAPDASRTDDASDLKRSA